MPRIRTGYSFRAAAGKLDDVIARLKDCEYPAAPMTDRASTFGWVKWDKVVRKAGMKPVFGVELAVSPDIHAKKPITDNWTFIAKDSLKPINQLIDIASQQFRYVPLLTYEQAQSVEAFKIVGHRSLPDLVHPADDLFLGLSPSIVKGYITAMLNRGVSLIACSDNYFPYPDDLGFYEVLCGRGSSTQSYNQFIQTPEEWKKSVGDLGLPNDVVCSAFGKFQEVLEQSSAELKRAELLTPEKPETLLKMCEDGAEKLNIDLGDEVYKARLDRELGLIEQKDYEDYFYIVADICRYARERMIVGPARGSSCGSLVCYLLEITTIDPIPFGLIFERFIDINRDDLPDIDIDFSDQQRYMVFDYMADKYGSDRVARLGTVAMFKPRSALQECSSALTVPRWMCDKVSESLIERSSGDSRALNTLEDTLRTMPAGNDLLNKYPEMLVASRMEGHPRHYSMHAAGIVVTNTPISDFIATDHRTGATMCDKKDAEELNLLKIDALGLTQLSVFEDALGLAGLPRDTLDNLPLDDPKAFEVLNRGHFSGIFQFNGIALQSVTKRFKVEEFNDIVSVTALGRPGPLASGGAHEWIHRRNGTHHVTYPHPVFEPYLKDTLGIVIYQEQVMEIGRNVGDLDWGQVTALRKAMSKSLGKEFFDQFGDPWKKGAIEKGVKPVDADKIWDDLCAYGSWSFNKSHSVAYGLISYWCCWLKANHPFEFAAAALSHEDNPDKQLKLLREMADEGYTYEPVNAEYSTEKWTVGYRDGKKILVGPLSNVKGVGPKMVQSVIGARARNEKIPERAQKLLANPKTPIDSLYPIEDAIKRVMPDPSERNIFTPPMKVKDIQIEAQDYNALLFCTFAKINPRDENEAVKVARRGGREIVGEPTASLNLQMMDDTDIMFGKISRWNFVNLGQPIVDRGRPGKALYAVKGVVKGGSSFRMMMIENVRYIGDMEE
jgi:DNA polymerase III alpha subunit